MNRVGILVFVLAVFTCAAYAGGPKAKAGWSADKVTGDYTLNNVYHRLVSAHEATGKHPQKGFFLSWQDSGRWYEIDFRDPENSRVNVFADGQARIGGLVSDGNEGAAAIGRYFGFNLLDGGKGKLGHVVDHSDTYRVSTVYYSEDARLALLEWCDSGTYADLIGQAIWPHSVSDGNLQVHNSPHNGD